MIRLAQDTIDKEDIQALVDWLSQEPTPKLTKSELTRQLEEEWSQVVGNKHSIFVNSGSSAILLGLYALLEGGFLKNKKVAVSSLSWATDVSSIFQLNLHPILVDCNFTDLSCDLNYLEEVFKREQPACLILVSVLGLVPEMEEIQKLCQKYDVVLFEDCAESLGSKYRGKILGSFGQLSIFSTYFAHILSTIEGGFCSTNDFKLYELLKMLRSHGWDRDCSSETQQKLRTEWDVDEFNSLYTFYHPGFNLRSTDFQAKIGLQQLKKLSRYCEIRNRNFQMYLKYVQNNELIIEPRPEDFVANFAFPVVAKNRKEIVRSLINNEVEVRPLIAGSIGRSPFWIKKYGLQSFPNCDRINDCGFYLPNHQDLTEEEIKFVAQIVNGDRK